MNNDEKDLEDFFSEESVSEHDLSSKATPVSNINKERMAKHFSQDGFEEFHNAVTPSSRLLRRGASRSSR